MKETHYQVRLYADIPGYLENYSCLCTQGNKEHPWGTTHETGEWARFPTGEAAMRAIKFYMGHQLHLGLYKRAKVFRITMWPTMIAEYVA